MTPLASLATPLTAFLATAVAVDKELTRLYGGIYSRIIEFRDGH
jgi:hypothetical protein